MNERNYISILSKPQWKRIRPMDRAENVIPSYSQGMPASHEIPYNPGMAYYDPYTQSDMLAEFYPSGHKINSPIYYPNVTRVVDEPQYDASGNVVLDDKGNVVTRQVEYEEMVPRQSFAFQQIIAAAHVYHATTNDVQHELAIDEPTEKQESLFNRICDGWMRDKMEYRWYEAFRARERVAEGAVVAHISSTTIPSGKGNVPDYVKKKRIFKALSFENGDQLYPQYDAYGNLIIFARLTKQYDKDGVLVPTLEVWDSKYLTVYSQDGGEDRGEPTIIEGIYGLDESWHEKSRTSHGFPFVPVAYMRNNNGPGWWASQDCIENYELSFSQMAHNNIAYGNSILVMKSNGEAAPDISRGLDGTIKAIYMDSESDAKFLEGQSASESYRQQLEKLEEMIYRCSNIVKSPADLKAGDTPATAIKLLFTPNMMQCSADLSECSDFLDKLWEMYAFAYGATTEGESFMECMSLPVINWANPYVPISESAVTADVVALAGAKIISRQTAAERVSFYAKPNEGKKVEAEAKREQDNELQYEIQTIKANNRYGSIGKGGGGTESHDKRDGDGDGIYDE